MRLLRPERPLAPLLGSRELEAVGWEAYLEVWKLLLEHPCWTPRRSCNARCAILIAHPAHVLGALR